MVKIGISVKGNKLDIDKIFNSDTMHKLGKQIQDNIIKNTSSGTDVNDRKFIPYAKSSKKYGKTVDLKQTGQMLRSFSIKSTVKKVSLYLNNSLAIKKAIWNQQHKKYERSFFGISNSSVKIIQDFVNKLLRNIK